MQGRKNYRKIYRDLRNAITQEQVCVKSEAICKQLLDSAEYKRAEIIYGYYPLGNEVNCLQVLNQALKDGKHVALPKTSADSRMDFYEITSFDDVVEGAFHIMEPNDTCNIVELSQNMDEFSCDRYEMSTILTLVPGVVFDRKGNRYGYGKGFYDRYFARFPELMRVALAYSEQISAETLECLDTDVKMHVIVTEKEIFKVELCQW